MPLVPTKPVPDLNLDTVGGTPFRLSARKPAFLTMIAFYRGLHCPICKPWLGDLEPRIAEFKEAGVDVIAVSCDEQERAEKTRAEWKLQNLEIAYGLDIPTARKWGLYISRSIKDGEPGEFAEPGIFLVRPDATLYSSIVSTMPFARPHFEDVLKAVQFIAQKDYPPRGEA